jgi:hypothetical protein
MGPMLMTGIACFGAGVAIALLATATARHAESSVGLPISTRSAILLMAFPQGIAVLGVVVGLLAVTAGAVSNPEGGLLVGGPAVAGAIVGLGVLVRSGQDSDQRVRKMGAAYIAGLGVLGVVVASLAFTLAGSRTTSLIDWPFPILGLASGSSALAIGIIGARAIRSMIGVDDPTGKALQAAQISRLLPFEAVAVGASAIAIVLVELR